MARRGRIFLGLNSGTSADGVDAAAIEVTGRGEAMKVRFLGHVARPYPADLRGRVFATMAPAATRTEAICLLEVEIGRAFAETAAALVKKLGLKRIDAIGSHGQTVCHLPPGRSMGGTSVSPARSPIQYNEPARGRSHNLKSNLAAKANRNPLSGTLQLGDAATIAARLNTPVVSHFRQADMAVGGQGAPLVPWTDWVLLRHPKRTRIIQNIGGIANLTYLPAGDGPDSVIAFDTGPGNMLIDALAAHFSGGKETCDRNGRRAAQSLDAIDPDIHNELLDHPHLNRRWPKSCGREEFGVDFMHALLRRHARKRLPADAWLATATAFTATSIIGGHLMAHRAATRQERMTGVEVILCGGGAFNSTLVGLLYALLNRQGARADSLPTTAVYGIPIDAKEAVSFAVLAAARVDRVPANLPQVTGAKRRVVLGDLCEPT